ncbi:MAG: PGF-pre-PGF domain-containing protein [Methanoregula sp.]
MRGTRYIPALICFALITCGMGTAMDWSDETADAVGNVGEYSSLTLDTMGRPHISYYDAVNLSLKYAVRNSSIWYTTTIDKNTPMTIGKGSSIAVDILGNPHISYYNITGSTLKFASWDGTVWKREIVDTSVGFGIGTSLKMNKSGYPSIGYFDLNSGNLNYAARDGTIWQKNHVDYSGIAGAYNSLAFDNAGNPGMSYYDAGNKDLKYALWNGTGWEIQTVDTTGEVGKYTSLSFDKTGKPHIGYYDSLNLSLKYAVQNGASWEIERLGNTGMGGLYASLALDPAGNPAVSYYDAIKGTLKYASKSGGVWQNETIDSSANVGQYTSLVFDSSGNPAISYYDVTHKDLKFARGYLPLSLNFSATPILGVTPIIVQFTDSSSGGSPSCWNWSFGDGTWYNTSQAGTRNPLHTYTTAGKFTVNLTVQNFSVADTLSRTEYIIVSDPPVTTIPTTAPTPPPSLEVFESSGDDVNIQVPYPVLTEVQSQGSLTTRTVNAGGDSAILQVTVTAEDVPDLVITATKITALPREVPAPDIPVYQYIGISPAQHLAITSAEIGFDVPLSFIDANHCSPGDIRLYRFDGDTWSALPTQLTGIKNGFALYSSKSPGFSFFAISRGDYQDYPPVTPVTTVLISPEPPHTVQPEYADVISMQISPTGQPYPIPPWTRFSGVIIAGVILAGIGITSGILIIRRWWLHRQNPALFEDYD